jgi:hypothetical protein
MSEQAIKRERKASERERKRERKRARESERERERERERATLYHDLHWKLSSTKIKEKTGIWNLVPVG